MYITTQDEMDIEVERILAEDPYWRLQQIMERGEFYRNLNEETLDLLNEFIEDGLITPAGNIFND